MTLRTTLTVVMTGVGAVAVAVALGLIVLTSVLYQTGLKLGNATERVRLLMELESYALQHVLEEPGSESQPPLDIIDRLRGTAGPDLRPQVDRLNEMINSLPNATTPAERQSHLDELVRDLRSVVGREDEGARRAMAEAALWNRAANITGVAALVVLIAGVTGALAWLSRGALQPLLTVIEAIQRFAQGDTNARAAEEGPSEIRQISVAFNDMAAALRRQREQQLAFIGGVAHDLRAPLNVLQVAVVSLGQPRADPEQIRERVHRQIERLDHMIADLLDRTRIEAGRFELRREDCDLRELLARVVDTQRDSALMRAFRLLVPHEPALVRCDALRMEQVITNLLSNALKYSPETSDVEIVLEKNSSTVVLSVTDHGIGITATDRTRLFEPFRRGTNVGSIGGMGLGLSVTRRIVEAHGGNIYVSSTPGAGSTFSVRLPLAAGAAVSREGSLQAVTR